MRAVLIAVATATALLALLGCEAEPGVGTLSLTAPGPPVLNCDTITLEEAEELLRYWGIWGNYNYVADPETALEDAFEICAGVIVRNPNLP